MIGIVQLRTWVVRIVVFRVPNSRVDGAAIITPFFPSVRCPVPAGESDR